MFLKSLPPMSRPHAAVELSVWALMAAPTGVLSGGVAGVLVNTVFAGLPPAWMLAVAVALLTGAGPLANMGSVFWAHWSQGRERVRVLSRLQLAFGACLLVAALAPLSSAGLILFVAAILGAQLIWCGIITVRASIWRANYPRAARATFAARNQALVSLISSAVAAITGWVVGFETGAYRWLLAATSLCVLGSFVRLGGLRVRRQRRLLDLERRQQMGRGFSPRAFVAILREDALYRKYMLWMMVLGSGNLMFTAPLILIMTNQLEVASFNQMLITAALPTLIVPVATPVWARILSRLHVIQFRSCNSRWYAGAILLALVGVVLSSVPVLWISAVVLGVGIGGGVLGWNLGHNDFATDARAAEYMGLHVSLTGVRGLIAPLIGVGLYGLLERAGPGLGIWSLALPLTLTSTGCAGFYALDRRLASTGFFASRRD